MSERRDTEALVEIATGVSWWSLDEPTHRAARRHIIDTIGAMIAGGRTELVHRVAGTLGPGRVAVVGRSDRWSPVDAAVLGGTAAHALELDDGYREGSVHPGACVLPAALASAGVDPVPGRRLGEAVVAGYEVTAALARAAHPALRDRGYHPTPVAGVMGAAIASGIVLGLGRTELRHALAIAASSAGGLFAFLSGGADVKRLHAGFAAGGAVRAARLAGAGVAGPPAIIETPDGFERVLVGSFRHPVETNVGGRPAINDCYLKPSPCCRHLQPAAEAIGDLRSAHAIAPGEIRSIEIATYRIAAAHASTGWAELAESQLSLPYVASVAALDGGVGLSSFDEERRRDPAVGEMAARVRVCVDDELDARYPADRPARVTIATARGRFTHTAWEALGSTHHPLDDEDVHRKFRSLAAPVIGADRADAVLATVGELDRVDDVDAELVRRTRPGDDPGATTAG